MTDKIYTVETQRYKVIQYLARKRCSAEILKH